MGDIIKARRAAEQLGFTGERLTFEIEGQAVYEHLHRYFFAREYCRGLDVLDVASGEGFGSAYLAQTARSVVGVDISEEAVAHARAAYTDDNLRFMTGDATRLDLPDASFDVVVSFETIEHLPDPSIFIREIRRVLRPEGLLIVSTPNRDVYSPTSTPANPFHVHEMTRNEFLGTVGSAFRNVTLYGQRPLTGTVMVVEDDSRSASAFRTFEKRGDSHFEASQGLARPLFFVAMASDAALPPVVDSVYIETHDVDAAIRFRREADTLRESSERERDVAHTKVEELRGAIGELATEWDSLQQSLIGHQAVSTALTETRATIAQLQQRQEERGVTSTTEIDALLRTQASLTAQVTQLTEKNNYLVSEATRAYWRPWLPAKYMVSYCALRLLSVVTRPFSRPLSQRLTRAVGYRSPNRFIKLPFPGTSVSIPEGIVLPEDDRPLTAADIDGVALPIYSSPRVSVIIPCYGKAGITLQCLKSIARHPPQVPFEVIVADDASGDPDMTLLGQIPGLRLEINPENLGFVRSCNRTAQCARGEYLFLLNNDTIVQQDWLDPLLDVFTQFPDAGLVGSKLLFPDGRLQEAGGIIWDDGSAWNYGRYDEADKPQYNYIREADYISGCAILIPRSLWNELDGFDEHFVPAYCEDSDLAFRVRAAGHTVYYCPFSAIVHLEGATNGTDVNVGMKAYQVTNTGKFLERWREELRRNHLPNGANPIQARDRIGQRKVALIVDHYVPQADRDAGSRTMLAMIESLLAGGHIVKFWPDNLHFDNDYTPVLQRMGVEVLYGNLSFEQWIRENGHAISIALLSRPTVAPHYVAPLRKHSRARLAYYGHDLHFQRLRMEANKTGNREQAAFADKIEATERGIWRQVDVVLYPSPDETAVVLADSPNARAETIIPYAYDDFGASREPPTKHEIIFVAGFAHQPNIDAAIWLVNEILPLIRDRDPGVTLSIVGANPSPAVRALAGDGVRVTGAVSEAELRASYARARLALVPLRVGAGVKSKVVEALREGLPLVTTSVGAQGLPGVDKIVAVADAPSALADAAVELLQDDDAWRRVSEEQVAYARRYFSRDAFNEQFWATISEETEARTTASLSTVSDRKRRTAAMQRG